MLVEVTLQSTDRARPNNKLWEQIESRQNQLTEFLQEEEPEVQSADLQPKAGFPTGLETFVIVVAVSFATGVAKGVAEGAGEEIGKPIGHHFGKKVGARIRAWLEANFPDTNITDVSDK
jgi:hypothetical protein